MANTILNLKNGSYFLIREIVASAGWANTPADMYTAGKLLCDVILELPPLASKAEMDNEAPVLELTDAQVANIKKALKHAIEKGHLFPSRFVVPVLEAFKLTE